MRMFCVILSTSSLKNRLCTEFSYNLHCFFSNISLSSETGQINRQSNNAYLLTQYKSASCAVQYGNDFLSNCESMLCFVSRYVKAFPSFQGKVSPLFWDSVFDVFPTWHGLIQRPSPCLSPLTIPARVC